jgi:hypothetical protein
VNERKVEQKKERTEKSRTEKRRTENRGEKITRTSRTNQVNAGKQDNTVHRNTLAYRRVIPFKAFTSVFEVANFFL